MSRKHHHFDGTVGGVKDRRRPVAPGRQFPRRIAPRFSCVGVVCQRGVNGGKRTGKVFSRRRVFDPIVARRRPFLSSPFARLKLIITQEPRRRGDAIRWNSPPRVFAALQFMEVVDSRPNRLLHIAVAAIDAT